MTDQTIAFIGGGNMATSLIGGLLATGMSASRIWVSDTDADKRLSLQQSFQVNTTEDNVEAVSRCDTVVLAVKPQVIATLAAELAGPLAGRHALIVSIAAGVREPDMRRWLGYDAAIVRTMPNTPALVGSGATALYANPFVSEEQRSRAESILRAVGITLWLEEESLLDAVTAVSGSGPAYFLLLMELAVKSAERLGLPSDDARMLVIETAFGAAKMALESGEDPATLRQRVTSPGGTTERALQVLSEGGIEQLVMDAITAARDRAAELGEQLGEL